MLNIPIISIIISCLLDNNLDVVRRNSMLIEQFLYPVVHLKLC